MPKALGVVYTGNAVATAFAAPIGSYLGTVIGWGLLGPRADHGREHGLAMGEPPAMPPQAANPVGKLFGLLGRRNVAVAMAGVMLTFAGAFATFTYLRPFLETRTGVTTPQLSLLLLGLGMAGFVGTSGASTFTGRHLYLLLGGLPVALAAVTLALLAGQHSIWAVAVAMVAWGAINSAIPVAWSTWLTRGISDEPESGGGLMVAAIQLAIMSGAARRLSAGQPLGGGDVRRGGDARLLLSAAVVGNGKRLRPATPSLDTRPAN